MLRDLNLLTILLRILLALVVGGIIGLERGSKNQPAGFRTYMLVCLGLAIGIGFYEGAILAGGAIMAVMTLLAKVEYRVKETSRYFRLYTNFSTSDAMNQFIDYCKSLVMTVVDIQISKAKKGVMVFITLKSNSRETNSKCNIL